METLMSEGSVWIETSRLYLREFVVQDGAALFDLNSDPEVMRYTGDQPFHDVSDARRFVEHYPDYRTNGFGRWAMIEKTSQEFLGWCGLRKLSPDSEVDLGFRLARKHWARGYATEAGQACLTWGFEHKNLDHIIGRATRENLPSVSVLQKLGMTFREISEEDEVVWLIYQLTREQFQSS